MKRYRFKVTVVMPQQGESVPMIYFVEYEAADQDVAHKAVADLLDPWYSTTVEPVPVG